MLLPLAGVLLSLRDNSTIPPGFTTLRSPVHSPLEDCFPWKDPQGVCHTAEHHLQNPDLILWHTWFFIRNIHLPQLHSAFCHHTNTSFTMTWICLKTGEGFPPWMVYLLTKGFTKSSCKVSSTWEWRSPIWCIRIHHAHMHIPKSETCQNL